MTNLKTFLTEKTEQQIEDVNFSVSNLEPGSQVCLLNWHGDIIFNGQSNTNQITIKVAPEQRYDLRVRKIGLLPFEMRDIFVPKYGQGVSVIKTRDHIYSNP